MLRVMLRGRRRFGVDLVSTPGIELASLGPWEKSMGRPSLSRPWGRCALRPRGLAMIGQRRASPPPPPRCVARLRRAAAPGRRRVAPEPRRRRRQRRGGRGGDEVCGGGRGVRGGPGGAVVLRGVVDDIAGAREHEGKATTKQVESGPPRFRAPPVDLPAAHACLGTAPSIQVHSRAPVPGASKHNCESERADAARAAQNREVCGRRRRRLEPPRLALSTRRCPPRVWTPPLAAL